MSSQMLKEIGCGEITRARFDGVCCRGELSAGVGGNLRFFADFDFGVLFREPPCMIDLSEMESFSEFLLWLMRWLLIAFLVISRNWRPDLPNFLPPGPFETEDRGVKNFVNRFGVIGGGLFGLLLYPLAPDEGCMGEDGSCERASS